MRNIEAYAENPFENLEVGQDKIVKFFEDHQKRIHQAVINGEPFGDLLPDTDQKFGNLKKSHSDTRTTGTQLKSRTISVDQYLSLFKKKALKCETKVLDHFDKTSAEYHEFFPNARSGYNNVNKGNIDTLFDQIILALSHHTDVMGEQLVQEFSDMKVQYDAARDEQLMQKENKGDSGNTWASNLTAMSDRAFENLLVISRFHRGHPERINQYFQQSIISLRNHPANDLNNSPDKNESKA